MVLKMKDSVIPAKKFLSGDEDDKNFWDIIWGNMVFCWLRLNDMVYYLLIDKQ